MVTARDEPMLAVGSGTPRDEACVRMVIGRVPALERETKANVSVAQAFFK